MRVASKFLDGKLVKLTESSLASLPRGGVSRYVHEGVVTAALLSAFDDMLVEKGVLRRQGMLLISKANEIVPANLRTGFVVDVLEANRQEILDASRQA